jgi:hypothetical protein
MNEYVVFCTTGRWGENANWIGEPPYDCSGVRRCFGSDPVEAINTILRRNFDEMPNAEVIKTNDDAVVHLAAILPPRDFWVTMVRIHREISMKEVLREILASGKHKHVLFVNDPDKGDSFEFGPEDKLKARLREVDYITYGVELLTAGEALNRFDFETLSDSSFKVQFH